MKKTTLSVISLLLAVIMLAGALASCGDGSDITTTKEPAKETTEAPTSAPTEETDENTTEDIGNSTDTTGTADTELPTELPTEEPTEEPTEIVTDPVLEGPQADLISVSNNYANGVQTRFENSKWETFIIENQNMSYAYTLPTEQEQCVSYIKNTQGKSYIENTMDVFVKMKDGDRVFASTSSNDAVVNILRFGYYYYDTRIEGQDFAGTLNIKSEEEVPLGWTYLSDIQSVTIVDGVLHGLIRSKSDPFIIFGEKFNYDTSIYNYIQITMKVESVTSGSLLCIAGSQSTFNSSQNTGFSIIPDGEYHTYTIKLANFNDYTGTLKGLRIDLDGGDIKSSFDISSIKLIEGEETGITTLQHARILHAYSNKLHQVIQIAATETTDNIEEIGMLTEIAADTVDKIIVKDANGLHETLEGVDWNSAEYVGFDIKGVGVFGYILPNDETSGNMTVTLSDDKYAIVQSRTPENNTILVGEWTSTSWENINDYYCYFDMGQRIYTDEHHSFDEFIKEAEYERNPLTANNIKVNTAYSDNGGFLGYDALRGSYILIVDGADSFDSAYYNYPNRHYNLNFTVKGAENDRLVYFTVESRSCALECSALLDENLMMLPIPLEVGKKFGGYIGVNIFDLIADYYGETTFPIIADADETREYTLVNLFQNWGNFPLKQLSFIEYHSPYYHLSTGVTETNCLVPWKFTSNPAVNNLLPDHRGMSAPLWSSQPQHTSSGSHTFLHYQDDKQNNYNSDVVSQRIDSSGPTYVDLEMTNISGDNKVKITYHHIEMPDTDENRAYYTMEYEFLEDLTVKDVRKNLYFYQVGSNSVTSYIQMGWLDENNQSRIANVADEASGTVYVLGDQCPYFDLFQLDNSNYGNVSMLIYNHEVILEGQKTDTALAIYKNNSSLRLTLDLGNVTFKAGDKITINAILMPWGSQNSDYSGVSYAPDQNVRDVRENTLLNPVVGTAVADCEEIESVFIPKFRTTNGESAEFTISGGKANEYTIKHRDGNHTMAVRIYGFKDLTVPKVYQKIDGEWVEYELSSANNLDKSGFGEHYDGYTVYYDNDGTYSYAFIVDVTDGKDKTFKIELDESFEK